MRRFVLAVTVTLGLLVLTPGPSWACSCAMASTPQHVTDAVTVAAGTVDWTATDGQTRTYKVDFDAVYKGAAAGSEKLVTASADSACGLGSLATGKRYLFFVEGKHPGIMRIGQCGGTVAYADAVARQVQAVTGPPGRPLSAPDTTTGEKDGRTDHSTRTTVIVAGGAAVLLAAGALAVRRRVRRTG